MQGHPGVTHSRNGLAVKIKQASIQNISSPGVSVVEVNRLLEMGKLLLAVLTAEERNELQELLRMVSPEISPQERSSTDGIGNTSVT